MSRKAMVFLSLPTGGLEGHFAEFGVGLGGSSLFFGQLAAVWGRKMWAVAPLAEDVALKMLKDRNKQWKLISKKT